MEWRTRLTAWAEAIGAGIAMAWGSFPLLVKLLIALMVLDLLGLALVRAKPGVKGPSGWQETVKKVYILLLVGASYLIWQHTQIPGADIAAGAVAGAFAALQLKWLLDKAVVLEVPIPSALHRLLKVVNEQYERPDTTKEEQ